MEQILERCAGLDVHKRTIVACVRICSEAGKRVWFREFGTMMEDLVRLRNWLQGCGVTHVAMESTGIYWRPVFNVLEDHFTVVLANPARMKNVPGRKTDVSDSEWIADLLAHGLLPTSFIPPRPIRELRDLTRYRRSLIQERSRQVNRLQRFLDDAGIRLSSVATDILGKSGRRIIEALLVGKKSPEELAELARGRLRNKIPELQRALAGRLREHQAFLVAEILGHIDELEERIDRVSEEVARRTEPFRAQIERLDEIPGVDARAAEEITAEIGPDMSAFPSAGHLASWAGVCPGNEESAGKRRSGKTRKGNHRLRPMLVQVALAASRTKRTYLCAQYHRLVPRLGKKKAVVAVAHSILVSIWHMLAAGTFYSDLGPDYFARRNPDAAKRRHVRALEELGYRVTLEPLNP